jgi:hypothetical protein
MWSDMLQRHEQRVMMQTSPSRALTWQTRRTAGLGNQLQEQLHSTHEAMGSAREHGTASAYMVHVKKKKKKLGL